MKTREIKFRVWDKKNVFMLEWKKIERWWLQTLNELSEEYVFMQFTGLKDCKGKDIYEGDIVEIWKETKTIEWDEHIAGFSWKGATMEQYLMFRKLVAEKAEVIGNIYENPNLSSS